MGGEGRAIRDGLQDAKHSNARGIASIRNAAARPYRVDSADPILVIQWTSALAMPLSRLPILLGSQAQLRLFPATVEV